MVVVAIVVIIFFFIFLGFENGSEVSEYEKEERF